MTGLRFKGRSAGAANARSDRSWPSGERRENLEISETGISRSSMNTHESTLTARDSHELVERAPLPLLEFLPLGNERDRKF